MLGVDSMTLAFMKQQAALLLTDTCTIERLSDTTGPAGEAINAWEVVSTGTACRVITESAQNSNRSVILAEQATLPERYKLVLPQGTTIEMHYRATLDSDGTVWLVTNRITSQTDEVTLQVVVVPEAA